MTTSALTKEERIALATRIRLGEQIAHQYEYLPGSKRTSRTDSFHYYLSGTYLCTAHTLPPTKFYRYTTAPPVEPETFQNGTSYADNILKWLDSTDG